MATDAPGTYVLAVAVSSPRDIRVGALGRVALAPGRYAYVGSAMNGLRRRIARHLGRDKKIHWHIDYLLREAPVNRVWYLPHVRRECEVARALAACFDAVAGFGCSDCRCPSHLFHAGSEAMLSRELASLGLSPSRPEEWR